MRGFAVVPREGKLTAAVILSAGGARNTECTSITSEPERYRECIWREITDDLLNSGNFKVC
jgi:hypothetical protein